MAKSPSKPSSDLVRENAALMAEASELYNQINGVWEKAELKLKEIGVLRPFTAYLETDEDGEEASFCVAKDSGRWRIYLIKRDVKAPEEHYDSRTLMTECPLDQRVYFVGHLTKLFERLVESNREAVVKLRSAAQKSAEVLKQLDLHL